MPKPNRLETRKPRKGDIGFWSYDAYPFLLSAEIEEVIEKKAGRWVVRTNRYGGHFVLRFSAPKKRGEQIERRLDALREQHRERLAAVRRIDAAALRIVLEDTEIPTNPYQDSMLKGRKGNG